MQKILVTGGAGFIGSHTVVALHEAGYTPVIIDDFSNSAESVIDNLKDLTTPDLLFLHGDVNDKPFMQKVMRETKPSAVIHFAAKKAVGESVANPLAYYRSNVDGLLTVLETMQENDIKSIVFSSSCTVYGEPDVCPVTEDTPQKQATSPYGATKQMCERILEDVVTANNSSVIALRYFNPVGAHPSAKIGELPLGDPNNLVPFLTQATAGLRGPLTVFGDDYDTPDGTCVRDFIHVMDLAEAHVSAVKFALDNQGFNTFNIGSGKGNSVLELINSFEKVTGQKVPYNIGARRPGDVIKIWANADKAKSVLGWQTTRSLDDSMRDAWRWQQSLTN